MVFRFAAVCAAFFLFACQPFATVSDTLPSAKRDFIHGAQIALLHVNNLCSTLGGQGHRPYLTVIHQQTGNIPITVRLYDQRSDGTVQGLGALTLPSAPTGATVFSRGFDAPCNETQGAVHSTYVFDISAMGQTITHIWGKYHTRLNVIH